MKSHYFNQEKADTDDGMLQLCITQGYVPGTCLLGGMVIMAEMNSSHDPCAGCAGPREKCHGRARVNIDKGY